MHLHLLMSSQLFVDVRVLASSLRKASIPVSCLIISSVSSHFHSASSLASPPLDSVNLSCSHLLSALKPPRTKQGKAAVAVKDGKSPWEWQEQKRERVIGERHQRRARRSLASKVRWDRGWQRVILWLTMGQHCITAQASKHTETQRNNACTSFTVHCCSLPFHLCSWWKAFSHFKYPITIISWKETETNTLTEIKMSLL